MEPASPIDLIKKVGKGKSLSKPMTREESAHAFRWMLEGRFTESQLGAFLQALRINELTQNELNGLSGALFESQVPVAEAGLRSLVLNTCHDSPRKRGYVSVLAGYLLPFVGVDVCIVNNTPLLAGKNPYPIDSFALGAELQKMVSAKTGAGPAGKLVRVSCNDLIPGWQKLENVRRELGFRSCLHTLEKLLNPWSASPFFLGISHKHYAERLGRALHFLGQPMGFVLLGNHGSLDLNLHKETDVYTSGETSGTLQGGNPASFGYEIPPSVYTLKNFESWRDQLAEPGSPLWRAVMFQAGFFYCLALGKNPDRHEMAQFRENFREWGGVARSGPSQHQNKANF